MATGGTLYRLRRASASALIVVLLFAVPAVAQPTTSTPVPAPPPAPAPTPAPTPDAPSAEETSPPTVPLDAYTAEFRERLAAKQAELEALKTRLDELDRELALAAEAYNRAIDRLNATRQRVDDTETDLTKANDAYAFQLDMLEGRANAIYRDGTFATIEVLLNAKSLNDFVARLKFLNTIGIADSEVAQALRGQKDLVEQTAEDLRNAEKQAEALEFELKARQIEVMLRIQEREEMLASTEAELLELLDSEAARRQVEEGELLRQIMSGAGDSGIVVAPGSPVETALAYHGIPYLWGGETPSGFDCSGLILYVFRQHGVELPHYSGSQFLLGQKVLPSQLQPGDVVFFGSPIHHVGLYIGGDHYLHAPRTGDFVKISKLSSRSDYAGARRYDWVPRQGPIAGVSTQPADPLATITR